MESLILNLSLQHSKIISIVGAGGKTSLMYALGLELAKQNKKTLVTTTTHIWEPSDLPGVHLITHEDPSQITTVFSHSYLAALGCPVHTKKEVLSKQRKWSSFSYSFLQTISGIPDQILCESDGSRHLPIKLPREKEPVFFPKTDTVLGVIGLSCLHQPASSCLFGLEQLLLVPSIASTLRGKQQFITEETILQIALSSNGLKKNVTTEDFHVVLNQADVLSSKEFASIKMIAEKIRDNGISCHIVSLKNKHCYF